MFLILKRCKTKISLFLSTNDRTSISLLFIYEELFYIDSEKSLYFCLFS